LHSLKGGRGRHGSFPRSGDAVAVQMFAFHICRVGLQDVTANNTLTSRTGSYWRWLSSGMLSTYMMTAAGQALWAPDQPANTYGAVSFRRMSPQ